MMDFICPSSPQNCKPERKPFVPEVAFDRIFYPSNRNSDNNNNNKNQYATLKCFVCRKEDVWATVSKLQLLKTHVCEPEPGQYVFTGLCCCLWVSYQRHSY